MNRLLVMLCRCFLSDCRSTTEAQRRLSSTTTTTTLTFNAAPSCFEKNNFDALVCCLLLERHKTGKTQSRNKICRWRKFANSDSPKIYFTASLTQKMTPKSDEAPSGQTFRDLNESFFVRMRNASFWPSVRSVTATRNLRHRRRLKVDLPLKKNPPETSRPVLKTRAPREGGRESEGEWVQVCVWMYARVCMTACVCVSQVFHLVITFWSGTQVPFRHPRFWPRVKISLLTQFHRRLPVFSNV